MLCGRFVPSIYLSDKTMAQLNSSQTYNWNDMFFYGLDFEPFLQKTN